MTSPASKRHLSGQFPLFVIETTMYICMSALPFG